MYLWLNALPVNTPVKIRHPGPPRNPAVRALVEGKRRWSAPPMAGEVERKFPGWTERGYLPHRDEPGLMQFVTFRLANSYPESLRSEWKHLWQIENDERRREELEAYLDLGRGECHLGQPDIAQTVEDALRFFHGQRYELRAWVVMPNHVHVLFQVQAVPMREIMESWKKHTAIKANRRLKRKGAFWQADYWDTYMRDTAHEVATRNYIENNPVKAGLVREPNLWSWSSARFRDAYCRLTL